MRAVTLATLALAAFVATAIKPANTPAATVAKVNTIDTGVNQSSTNRHTRGWKDLFFTVQQDSRIVAVNTTSGSVHWTSPAFGSNFETGYQNFWISETSGYILVNTGFSRRDSRLIAYSSVDGTQLYNISHQVPFYGYAIIGDHAYGFTGFSSRDLSKFDFATGNETVVRATNYGGRINSDLSATIWRDISGMWSMEHFDLATESTVWTIEISPYQNEKISSFIAQDQDYIYLMDEQQLGLRLYNRSSLTELYHFKNIYLNLGYDAVTPVFANGALSVVAGSFLGVINASNMEYTVTANLRLEVPEPGPHSCYNLAAVTQSNILAAWSGANFSAYSWPAAAKLTEIPVSWGQNVTAPQTAIPQTTSLLGDTGLWLAVWNSAIQVRDIATGSIVYEENIDLQDAQNWRSSCFNVPASAQVDVANRRFAVTSGRNVNVYSF